MLVFIVKGFEIKTIYSWWMLWFNNHVEYFGSVLPGEIVYYYAGSSCSVHLSNEGVVVNGHEVTVQFLGGSSVQSYTSAKMMTSSIVHVSNYNFPVKLSNFILCYKTIVESQQ